MYACIGRTLAYTHATLTHTHARVSFCLFFFLITRMLLAQFPRFPLGLRQVSDHERRDGGLNAVCDFFF